MLTPLIHMSTQYESGEYFPEIMEWPNSNFIIVDEVHHPNEPLKLTIIVECLVEYRIYSQRTNTTVPGNPQLAFAGTQSCSKIPIVASQTDSTILRYRYSCVDFSILPILVVFVHGERIRYGTDATTRGPRNAPTKSIRFCWFRCRRRSAQLTHLFRIIPTAELGAGTPLHSRIR